MRRLWLQDAVGSRGIRLSRIDGKRNPADPLTTLKSFDDSLHVLKAVNVH